MTDHSIAYKLATNVASPYLAIYSNIPAATLGDYFYRNFK